MLCPQLGCGVFANRVLPASNLWVVEPGLHQLHGAGEDVKGVMGQAQVSLSQGTLGNRVHSAVLSHSPVWSLDQRLWWAFQAWHIHSRVRWPPELCGVSTSGSLSGYLEKVILLDTCFCLFAIILPIREPMLTQRRSLLVFVGPTVYCRLALNPSCIFPGMKLRLGGVALTRWKGDGGGGWLLTSGQSGKILDPWGHT